MNFGQSKLDMEKAYDILERKFIQNTFIFVPLFIAEFLMISLF